MSNEKKELQIVETDALTPEEKTELSANIDRLIEAHKNNRQAINRLVFESVAAMTEADDAATTLSRKGRISRWIGGITGTNQKLQNTINKNRSAAQYASQQTLQKLAEQNLMTFDLITAVNNKLNASLNSVNAANKALYVTKQMNMTLMQQEMCLQNMKTSEQNYAAKKKQTDSEIEAYKRELDSMLAGV